MFDLSSAYFWLTLGLILIGLEFLVSGVYLLWVGAAALAVALIAYIFQPLSLSIFVFIALFFTCTMLSIWIGLKIQAKRKYPDPNVNKRIQSYKGTIATVIAGNTPSDSSIRIQLDGTSYNANCVDTVVVGDSVVIVQIVDGNFITTKTSI